MKGDGLEKGKSDLGQLLGMDWFETFRFKILSSIDISVKKSHFGACPVSLSAPISCATGKGSYLDCKLIINLHSLAKNEQVLHEVGKLPHVSKTVKYAGLLRWRMLYLHLLTPAFSGSHGEPREYGGQQGE